MLMRNWWLKWMVMMMIRKSRWILHPLTCFGWRILLLPDLDLRFPLRSLSRSSSVLEKGLTLRLLLDLDLAARSARDPLGGCGRFLSAILLNFEAATFLLNFITILLPPFLLRRLLRSGLAISSSSSLPSGFWRVTITSPFCKGISWFMYILQVE